MANCKFSASTEGIFITFKMGEQQVDDSLNLHNSPIDCVAIQSQLKNLIGVKMVGLKCLGCLLVTGPKAIVWDVPVLRPIAIDLLRFQP